MLKVIPMPTKKEIDIHKHAVVALVEKMTDTANAEKAGHQVLIDACVVLAVMAAKEYHCCTRKTAIALDMASSQLKTHMQQNPLLYTPTSPTKH